MYFSCRTVGIHGHNGQAVLRCSTPSRWRAFEQACSQFLPAAPTLWRLLEHNAFHFSRFSCSQLSTFDSRIAGFPHLGHPGHCCAEPSRHCGTMSRTKTPRRKEIIFCVLNTTHRHFGVSLSIMFCVFHFPLFIPILDTYKEEYCK